MLESLLRSIYMRNNMTRLEALKVVLKFLEKYLKKNIDMELQIAYDTLNNYLKEAE